MKKNVIKVEAEVVDAPKKIKPAINPEARENQMIHLATNLAEEQLRDGTASSAVIVHYLKLGTEKVKLERIKLEQEVKLTAAKTKAIESGQENEQRYVEAIEAMKRYSGSKDGT